MTSIRVGDTVKTLDHKRTRSIFANALVTPGVTTHYGGGKVGRVVDIYNDGYGSTTYVVSFDDSISGYGYEFDSTELVKA